MADGILIDRLISVIENDILAKTRPAVDAGNKIFGAAILRKADYALVIAETNNEMENPLWHGEVHAIKRFYELAAAERPNSADCVFLATHEPCSLCLSAITWAGFDNFYYLFSHEESRDDFAIPHDLRILREVFRLSPGGYARQNAYWQCTHIPSALRGLADVAPVGLAERMANLKHEYDELSDVYQRKKSENTIPLA